MTDRERAKAELRQAWAELLEEARATFRVIVLERFGIGRRRRALEFLEARIRRLERELDLEARLRQAAEKQLGSVTATLDELIGIVAAMSPWAVDVELADLLADPRHRQYRREGLEAARELRARANTAKVAAELARARGAIRLMLGHREADAPGARPPAEALEFTLEQITAGGWDPAKTGAARARLVVPALDFDEESSPDWLVRYLSSCLERAVEGDVADA